MFSSEQMDCVDLILHVNRFIALSSIFSSNSLGMAIEALSTENTSSMEPYEVEFLKTAVWFLKECQTHASYKS